MLSRVDFKALYLEVPPLRQSYIQPCSATFVITSAKGTSLLIAGKISKELPLDESDSAQDHGGANCKQFDQAELL